MIPDLTQSSSQLQIKPSIKNAAVCKLKNSGDRLKTSDKASKKLLRKNGSSILEGFAPGKYDVLCNRSRHAFNHVGNRRFRVIVENHAPGFAALRTKAERSLMIQSILGIIKAAQGKFVEKNKDGTWDEVGLVKRKEKVGHALRAAITAVKSKDKTRTIYDVLGVFQFVPSNSISGSSTQTNNHVKNEDSSETSFSNLFHPLMRPSVTKIQTKKCCLQNRRRGVPRPKY
ncbi:hypothetical protein MHU86_24275 [Fragilaria crotonensis]|nr:hypothetical protein MHU86_24275 [Fragilaria crotonensis]